MNTERPLRVCIEAQIETGVEGGLEQHVRALVGCLVAEHAADATVAVRPDHSNWLPVDEHNRPRLVRRPTPAAGEGEPLKRQLGRWRAPLGRGWRAARRLCGLTANEMSQPVVVESDGFYEGLDVDVVHFPYVGHYEQVDRPSVLSIHDLQHVHFPQFFTPATLRWREEAYRRAASHATLVTTASEHARNDIVRCLDVPRDKVEVVHHASFLWHRTAPCERVQDEVRARYGLPQAFALYPALTYEHKNHRRLLDAVASLRSRGTRVNVVCAGRRALAWPHIQAHLESLNLGDQVLFLGFVPEDDLVALYGAAQFLIYPTLFEGAGLPVLESMHLGLPMACADIHAVREYADDAALYFDPTSTDAVAAALTRMSTDVNLRAQLRERGFQRGAIFEPQAMAARYLAIYREAILRWAAARRVSVENEKSTAWTAPSRTLA